MLGTSGSRSETNLEDLLVIPKIEKTAMQISSQAKEAKQLAM